MRSIITAFGAAKALLKRVRLLSFIGYVEGRVAVFAGGVFVVISSLHYAHYYENYAEYGEKCRRAHAGRHYRPEYAEYYCEYRANKFHPGRPSARLYAFHKISPLLVSYCIEWAQPHCPDGRIKAGEHRHSHREEHCAYRKIKGYYALESALAHKVIYHC